MTARPRSKAIIALGVGAMLFGVSALGVVRGRQSRASDPALAVGAGDTGQDSTTALQARLERLPGDYAGWATLGLIYVSRARVTGDPSYYPKSAGVLARSLAINTDDNDVGAAGMAALAAARHDFASAADWARKGLAINPASPLLYGVLNDSETQLGHYPEAFEAAQRMVDLRPDSASLARASYTWELRGDLTQARELMQRSLADATNASDRAFARDQLGELALSIGDAAGALDQFQAGLAADASYAPLLEGKAKAEAALGHIDTAVADFERAVARAPQPAYLLEFGELLESIGRRREAQDQYQALQVEQRLFEANGVALDVEPTLYAADHGDAAAALEAAKAGIAARPFLDMDDAYAWALHANGRDAEALEWSTRALATGARNALFHYHQGIIRQSLGDSTGARQELSAALEINPHFKPLGAPAAREALKRLGAAA